jgi:drug/metabolite transporter (DMT)-like permease
MARSPVRAFIVIFLLGFSIRLYSLAGVPERRLLPNDRWEDTAIATALVERGEFADPYVIPTGPSAHLPPFVPGILAMCWSLFGMSVAGGYAVWILSITAFSTLYAMLPWLGGRLGPGREAGVLGGIAGALIVLPPGNGEELAAIFLGLVAVVFLRRWTSGLGSLGASLLLGVASGVAFHLQPVLLPVVLGWMVFEVWWSRDSRKWRLSAVMVLGMVMACIPWGWRNYTVFDEVLFIRGNFGLELRMGNHERATGAMDVMVPRGDFRHPRAHVEEAQLILELGEAEYMKRARIDGVAICPILAWALLSAANRSGDHGFDDSRSVGCVARAPADDAPAAGRAHDTVDLLPAYLLLGCLHAPLPNTARLDSAAAGRRRGLGLAREADHRQAAMRARPPRSVLARWSRRLWVSRAVVGPPSGSGAPTRL